MPLFVGGPYHGRDLPIASPLPPLLYLPGENELEAFLEKLSNDPRTTVDLSLPFIYELDRSTHPEFFRCVR